MIPGDDLRERVTGLGDRFRGRLDGALLDDAMDYVTHNECVLALEVLAELLFEHRVAVSSAEAAMFEELLEELPDGSPARIAFLSELRDDSP